MMNVTSGCAMLHGLACRPGIISGSANGMKSVVPTVSSVMSVTAKPRSPWAPSTSFGRKGAPAAPPSRIRPIACGRSRGMTMVRRRAKVGAATKLIGALSTRAASYATARGWRRREAKPRGEHAADKEREQCEFRGDAGGIGHLQTCGIMFKPRAPFRTSTDGGKLVMRVASSQPALKRR